VKGLILDASMTMEWFADEPSLAALEKRSLLDDHVALVPHLWRFEVMNVVNSWRRRRIVSEAEGAWILRVAMQVPFAIVEEGDPEAIVNLALAHDLSAYDATYLHVAMISGEPLATLDRRLQEAAVAVGVTCL
jgi:predicted nucleic acid-binding protein